MDDVVTPVRKMSINDQWWELHDPKRNKLYYYHPNSGVRQWQKPEGPILLIAKHNQPAQQVSRSLEELKIDPSVKKGGTAGEVSPRTRPHSVYSSSFSDLGIKKGNTINMDKPPARPAPTINIQSMAIEPTSTDSPTPNYDLSDTEKQAIVESLPVPPSPNNDNQPTEVGPSQPVDKGPRRTVIPTDDLAPGWIKVMEEETGKFYYVNIATKEATWSRAQAQGGLSRHLSTPNLKKVVPNKAAVGAYTKNQNLNLRVEEEGTLRKGSVPKEVLDQLKADKKEREKPHALEEFANQHFDLKKTFGRHVPVRKMITWSKDALSSSLIKFVNHERGKEAAALSTLILTYMGDKPSSEDPNQMVIKILEKAIQVAELRDEIYCQLVKQTTGNPNIESLRKGWELFILCCSTFPPTRSLEAPLKQYISEHIPREDRIGKFASHCVAKLESTFQHGARRLPTIEEIATIKNVPFLPSVFGVSLSKAMELQKKYYPRLAVPLIMTTLTDAVIKYNGCSTEGIFRVSGQIDKVEKLKMQIEQGNYEVLETDPHISASLLKLWLKSLPEPLFPDSLYDACLQASNDPANCVAMVEKLPKVNKRVVCYLVRFLQIVLDPANQVKTKMTVNNIAMVFAPNLLRCPDTDPQKILEKSQAEQKFVKKLILNLKL